MPDTASKVVQGETMTGVFDETIRQILNHDLGMTINVDDLNVFKDSTDLEAIVKRIRSIDNVSYGKPDGIYGVNIASALLTATDPESPGMPVYYAIRFRVLVSYSPVERHWIRTQRSIYYLCEGFSTGELDANAQQALADIAAGKWPQSVLELGADVKLGKE